MTGVTARKREAERATRASAAVQGERAPGLNGEPNDQLLRDAKLYETGTGTSERSGVC